MVFNRLRDALGWRWHRAARLRYLRTTFTNGEELARSYLDRTPCDTAVCRDGTVIRHPAGRAGLAGMILEVWFDEVYTGAFYTPRPGDVVIDAGANIGLFSLAVARRCRDCRVLAYEPFDQNYQALRQNLAAGRAAGVRAYHLAVSGAAGVAAMTDGGGRSQDHRLTAAAGPAAAGVRTVSLADVFATAGAGEVALFKCDIEGSEADVFRHASAEQLRRAKRYAIEYHDNLRPGTLALLQERLRPTHDVVLRPAAEGGYGMLYATARPA